MNTPKVLVGTSVHFSKDYCLEQYIETLMGLTYPNIEYFLSDNSPDKNHSRNIMRRYGIECGWVQPKTNHNFEGIALSQNQIRNKVLYSGAIYWLNLEQDVICDPSIIEILISHKKQVVSAPYFIGQGSESQIALMDLEDFVESPINRLIPFEESFLKLDGTLQEVKGAGVGACLIHRSVLEQIDFGIVQSKKHIPSDTYFYVDLQRLGIKNYLDTSLMCKHNNQQWKITM